VSLLVVYDTMLFLQAAVQPVRVHRSFQAGHQGLVNLAIHAQAEYLVTWETRMLKFANDKSESAELLRRLAPQLRIVNPERFAQVLKDL
jgi:predicted nucleic acid-binding protein